MELDVNLMTISCLSVVILMLLVYIAWRFREEKFTLAGLNVDDFLERAKESERLLFKIKEQNCWNCGSNDKDISGNLFEDNELKIRCKQCGTVTFWKRGKEWAVSTETGKALEKLKSLVGEESKVEKLD